MTETSFVETSTKSKVYNLISKYPVRDIDGKRITKETKANARPPRKDEVKMTTVEPHRGVWYFPVNKVDELCEAVVWDTNNRVPFYATESIQRDDNPIRLDIDMKTIFHTSNETYKRNRKLQIEKISKKVYSIFCKALKKMFVIENRDHMRAFVLLKRDLREDVTNKNGVKYVDGIHMLFPFVRSTSDCLKTVTDMVVLEASNTEDIFTGALSAQTCIDNIETKNWTVPGSSKEGFAYECQRMYTMSDKNTVIDSGEFTDFTPELVKILLIHNYKNIPKMKPTEQFQIKLDERERQRVIVEKERQHRMKNIVYSKEDVEKASQLSEMLKSHRFEDYNGWFQMGRIYHSISKGHEDGLELWKTMSEMKDPVGYSKPGTQQKIIDIWENLSVKAQRGDGGSYTLGILVNFAKEDDYDKWDAWRRNTYNNLTEKTISQMTEGVISRLAKHLYGREYIYTKEGNWWRFTSENGHWEMDPYKECKFMFDLYSEEMKRYLIDYIQKGGRIDLHKYTEKVDTKFDTLAHIQKCLKFSQRLFATDVEFEQKLDRNKWLIGTRNGVYDMRNGVFRKGIPEDFVSMKLGASYREHYTWDHPDVKSVMRFHAKFMVDPVMRDYYLMANAITLIAGNVEKSIYFLTNRDGNAGKSKQLDFMRATFGDYSEPMDQSRFTTGNMKSVGGHSQDLANMNCKRHGFTTEISSQQTFSNQGLKQHSDTLQVRGMWEKGKGGMTPLYTIWIMLNKVSPINDLDKPTENRIKIIICESTFDEHAPTDPKEQWRRKHFPLDKHVDTKLKKLVDANLWILFEYIKKYMNAGQKIVVPEKVKRAVKEYARANNIMSQFVDGYFEIDLQSDPVHITTELYENYTRYLRMATRGRGIKAPEEQEFRKDILTYIDSIKTVTSVDKDGTCKYYEHVKTMGGKTFISGFKVREKEGDDGKYELNFVDEDDEDEEKLKPIEVVQSVVDNDKFDEEDYKKYGIGPTFLISGEDENVDDSMLLSDNY